jgi:hypothetical protein
MKNRRAIILLTIPLIFFVSCMVSIDSVVEKSYNSDNNLLIIIQYTAENKGMIRKFGEEFNALTKNSKNKVVLLPVDISKYTSLRLNSDADIDNLIKSAINRANIKTIIYLQPTEIGYFNSAIVSMKMSYIATGFDVVSKKQIWKSTIDCYSSIFAYKRFPKKIATKLHLVLVSDSLIVM